jgi:hypothetical protein
VRAANGSIVQFVYGNDGLDGSETVVLNGKPAICNMSRIIDKYNLTQEKHTRCSNKWKKLSQKLMNIADYSSSSLSEEDISEEDISSNNSSVASSGEGSDSELSSTSQEDSVEEDSEEGGETDLDIEEDDWDDEDDMEEDEDDMEEDDNDI